MRIVSRKEAITEGLGKYFTGRPCKHGHIAHRYVLSGECVACRRIHRTKNDSSNEPVTTVQPTDIIIPTHDRTLSKIAELKKRFNISRNVLLYAALDVGLKELLNIEVNSINEEYINTLGKCLSKSEHQ